MEHKSHTQYGISKAEHISLLHDKMLRTWTHAATPHDIIEVANAFVLLAETRKGLFKFYKPLRDIFAVAALATGYTAIKSLEQFTETNNFTDLPTFSVFGTYILGALVIGMNREINTINKRFIDKPKVFFEAALERFSTPKQNTKKLNSL